MTTSSTSAANTGQWLLNLLSGDALISFGPSLIALINGVAGAGTDPVKVFAAWAQFRGSVLGSGVALEATFAQQLDTLIVGKLTSAIAAAQASVNQAGNGPAPAPTS